MKIILAITDSKSAADIIAYANHTRHFQSTDAISMYAAEYITSLLELGKPFLETVDGDKALIVRVKDKITFHRNIIIKAAKEFDIDPYLLGAIIIDEIVRMNTFETIEDIFWLDLIGKNVSVGIAQVTLETANNVIKRGLYNPNPEDKKLPFFGNLTKKDRQYLFPYVIQPKYNIRFAAAYIRDIINVWASKLDISNRPEILGTLYAKGYGDPKTNPAATKRGSQIANEFYLLAKKWLSKTHPVDAETIEQHAFLGTRYINTSECTYSVGEFRSTSLPREVLLEKYKNITVDLFGFAYNIPVNVIIVDNDASLPLDEPADEWLHDFLPRVDSSSSEITYYLVYLYEIGRSSLGDYRCYE